MENAKIAGFENISIDLMYGLPNQTREGWAKTLRSALAHLDWRPTVFIVSQRTSSIRHANLILVLEDGKVAGMGTHGELMENCPVYREIHESQFGKEDAE